MQFVRMILDPCNALLVPGLYGASEGLLARTKTTFNVVPPSAGAPNTAGYVLWCPDFHVPKGSGPGNLLVYLTSLSNSPPANTATFQYGNFTTQPTANTAFTLSDPAGPLCASDIVGDARILSACMTMTFLGKMVDSAGEVCFLQNLPIPQLVNGGAAGTPVTVDELFNYAADKQRIGVETLEAVYRLNAGCSDRFRDESVTPLLATSGQPTIEHPNSEAFAPRCFGFAWRGVTGDSALSFDFVKNIEWRPEAISGFSQVPILNTGPGHLETALKYIDKMAERMPNLYNHAKGAAFSYGARMVKNAFTGGAQRRIEL